MSTYGTLIVADVESRDAAQRLETQFRTELGRVFQTPPDFPFPLSNPLDDASVAVDENESGVRVTLQVSGAVADANDQAVFTGVGPGRAVLCDDGDEYGVVFSVWDLGAETAECVYRAMVHDPDQQPEAATVARVIDGVGPATRAAQLYGATAQSLLGLEQDPSPIADALGFVGTPFEPWLGALAQTWPQL